MKKQIIILLTLLISITAIAQQGINYKAILKDTNGNVLAGEYMTVQFTIHQTTTTGTIAYQEDHNYTTDTNGLLILTIGTETPSVGAFSTIDWAADVHFLQTTIIYSGGTINFDATEFMAVPYAKHAQTSETAANVFSGDYNDLTNQPTTIPTGLEKVTDSIDSGTGLPIYGWRLIGSDPDNYGPIGDNAIDLSYSALSSSTLGATGNYSTAMGRYTTASGWRSTAMGNSTTASGDSSTAMGYSTTASGVFSTAMGSLLTASGDISTAMGSATTASGDISTTMGGNTVASGNYSTAMGSNTVASGNYSTAMGYYTTASGRYSTAMGRETTAPSYVETVIGQYNTDYTPDNTTDWDDSDDDRLFVIGNGISSAAKHNALTVLKNGNIGVGSDTPSSLLEVAHTNGSPLSQSLSILNTDTSNSWQFHTTSYLNLYRNGTYRGSWNATSGAYVQVSDRRLKKDIINFENGTLHKVMQLNPVSYLMKDQTDSKRNLGLISQEVQKIFPSITNYNKEADILTLSYTELIPVLIKATQEQQEIIETQNKNIENLIKRIEALENKNN